MKFCISIVLTLVFIGCGKGPNTIDPAFQPLYNQFIAQANASGLDLDFNQNITIQFAPLEQADSIGEVVGECTSIGFGNGIIYIATDYWNSADANTRLILLYHELGHCVLSEVHTQNTMAIMNPLITNPQQYDATDLKGMIDQLFLDTNDYRLSQCNYGRC